MTDAVRELFEMLAKKEKSGSDYTGRVTRVEGGTAYVQFDGSDIPNTPVALSIGAKAGDEVRIRVADGKAWIVGNDTNPPTDDSAAQEVAEEMVDMRTRVTGLQGQYTEIQRTADNISTIVSDGDKLVSVINQSAGEVLIQAEKINLDGYTKISEGEIGGFKTIKGDKNCADKTTQNGGHAYPTSFYKQMDDGTYEYEVGMKGDNNPGYLNFYVKRMTKGGAWSSASNMFYVNNSGKLYTKNAEIDDVLKITKGTMTAQLDGAELKFTDSRFANYMTKIGYGITSFASNTHYIGLSGGALDAKSGNAWASINGNSVDVGFDDGTYNRQGRFTASAAGNIGLYDAGNANYIIYSASDFKVHVPHQFLCCGADESSTTQRVPVGSSNVADQGVQWLGGTGANTLAINAEWNSGSFETKTIAVSSSDIRLKDNVTDTDVNALEFINRVKLHAFDWKWTHQHQDIGVIADELEQLDPSLVVGGGTDKEGNPIYKSINNLVLISYLTKAVQELSTKVEELEHKLSTMEDKNHGHS